MVASGTREASVFDRLKISRHTKIMNISATDISTASSFATIELTSCYILNCEGGKGGTII